MVNVRTTGGLYGFNVGNQQFTMRELTVSNAVVGINQLWSWGWTYQNLAITNCSTAFSMSNGGPTAQDVGTINILDSTITNCPVFVNSSWTTTSQPATAGSLNLENIQLHNVSVAVKSSHGTVLAGSSGTSTIAGWLQGHKYTPTGPTNYQGTYTPATRPSSLLESGSTRYWVKNKPPYAATLASNFVSIRSAGAKGDGITDDTTAIQNAITDAASAGKYVFLDYGVYKVTNTIYLPPRTHIVGESYPLILAAGSVFSHITKPIPVLQVGKPGDSGDIELQDFIVGTRGPAKGAVLIEYNLNAVLGAGVWDVHARIGGFTGSNLVQTQCPTNQSSPSSACEAAYMSVHITSAAQNAYLENCWFWTADHNIDSPTNTQISVYTGRGMLVEGTNVWL
jgi:glucan 1,3-beta-glucosidase